MISFNEFLTYIPVDKLNQQKHKTHEWNLVKYKLATKKLVEYKKC